MIDRLDRLLRQGLRFDEQKIERVQRRRQLTAKDLGKLHVLPKTVYPFDEEITAASWAAAMGTIAYTIVCGIGPRVPRVYVSPGSVT